MSNYLDAALQQNPSLLDGLPLNMQLPIVVLTVNQDGGDVVDARVISRDILTAILTAQTQEQGGMSWDANGDSHSLSE